MELRQGLVGWDEIEMRVRFPAPPHLTATSTHSTVASTHRNLTTLPPHSHPPHTITLPDPAGASFLTLTPNHKLTLTLPRPTQPDITRPCCLPTSSWSPSSCRHAGTASCSLSALVFSASERIMSRVRSLGVAVGCGWSGEAVASCWRVTEY